MEVDCNIVSSLSLIGRRIEYLDFERLQRITEYIEGLLPPRLQDLAPDAQKKIDPVQAARGEVVFGQQCARCHAPTGDRFGHVEPASGLGTDPLRYQEFTAPLQDALNRLGTRQWQLRNFRMQTGYVNNLLDGIWLRAPYLHNGSVPTLDALLRPQAQRPPVFCRGSDVYDWALLGWRWQPVVAGGQPACPGEFLYDTRTPRSGRDNGGNLYGTDLPEPDRQALLAFLRTL